MFVCEFCGKELSTKTVLRTHQEKAKYCLEKQNRDIKPDIKCEYCDKSFIHKHRKNTHETKCQVRLERERSIDVYSLKDQIKELEQYNIRLEKENIQLKTENEGFRQKAEIYTGLYKEDQLFILEQSKRLVEKSGTTNIKGKNITMNALNLSQERLLSIKDTYTLKHYEQGGIGQADWVVENVLKDESENIIYKCTDKNRKNFIYQDDKGNIITDIHAKKLKEAILPMIETKLKEYKKVKYNELADQSDDESELLEQCNILYRE